MKTLNFQGVGGLNIFARAWRPEAVRPKGLVVIAHGVLSHSGYYEWVGEQLLADGFAVYAIDHRGRGRSDGERFFVEKIDDYVADLGTLIDLAQRELPGVPTFLLGHSAGGVISSIYTLENQAKLTGFICESFAFQVYAPDFALAVVKGLSHVFPHAHVLKLPIAEFSRDPKVIEFMNDDPLIAGEVQPTTTVAALVRALEHDSSQQALQRAIAAVRVARGVSPSRAYAMLVRASAGCPAEESAPRLVPAQREPLLAS